MINFKSVDYKGRTFSEFYVSRDSATGPGWYIFGRNPEYNNSLIMLCGRPDVKARKHPHYNCKVRRGWNTKKEATQAIGIISIS